MSNGPLGNVANPKLQFFLPGTTVPLAGGLLFTYAAGTTTKQNTYINDSATPNTNPIVLDANGQCVCFVDTTLKYDFTLAPSNDSDPPTNAYWTVGGMGYQEMIAAFAPINSPTFTGTPKAPTPTTGDSSSNIATTQFVQTAVTSILAGTPTASTAAPGTNTTQIATTAFVGAEITRAPQRKYFASSSTFNVPSGVTQMLFKVWAGGGGGGAGLSAGDGGSGGGGGGYVEDLYSVTGGNTLTLTVGTAGAGSTTSANGGAGGTSSVTGQNSGTCSATGGSGGVSSSLNTPGGVGGSGSGQGDSFLCNGQRGGEAFLIGSMGVGGKGGGAFCTPSSDNGYGSLGIFGSSPGGGGGGGGNTNGGNSGGNGAIILEWLQP